MKKEFTWKFELTAYIDKTQLFNSWSYRAKIVSEYSYLKDLDIEKITDRFDHATLISKKSKLLDFIKKESDRHIIFEEDLEDWIIWKIIFSLIFPKDIDKNILKTSYVILEKDFSKEKYIITAQDLYGYSLNENFPKTEFSNWIFNS